MRAPLLILSLLPLFAACDKPRATGLAPAAGGVPLQPSFAPQPQPAALPTGAPQVSQGNACPEADARLCGMLEAHNQVRRSVSPVAIPPLEPLVWSTRAAQVAQSWANRCQFEHNPNAGKSGLGENLFAVWGGQARPTDPVTSWHAERNFYAHATNACSKECGHYTQLVWRTTKAVGCGMARCADGMEVWVCDYEPAGNYVGERPY